MNGCHQDAGHQGQQQMLWLLHDQFWWPGMAEQIQKAINSCDLCIQHEGSNAEAPMWPIIVTTPLELLHVDITSIETTVELDQPQTWWTFWSFMTTLQNMLWHMWSLIKTWKLLLSFCSKSTSWSSENWPSSWVTEGPTLKATSSESFARLWAYGRFKTSPYHDQTNGQVEWAHQMLLCMIGKLSKDWKADWAKHLSKLVHAYNSTRLAITRYILHYLMFGHWMCLPVDLYFPTIRGTKNTSMLTTTLPSYVNNCRKPLKRLKCSPQSEAERQKRHYNRKANAVSLEPGDLDLAKADAYRGRSKVKDWWEEEPYKVECQVAEGIPSYIMKHQQTGCSWVLHWNQLFLITPMEWTLICMIAWAKQARYTTITLENQTPEESENEEAPQSADFPLLAQHQRGETPLAWVNRKLCAFMQMFSRASLLDKGKTTPAVCMMKEKTTGKTIH